MHGDESAPSGAAGAADPLLRVGVVVVTYRSQQLIGALLTSLPIDRLSSVVVVDNASDDDSVAVARAHEDVRVVINETNVGFGAACNVGASRSARAAELLLFINPDARINASDLERLVSYLDGQPRTALVAPRLMRDGEPLPSSGDEATLLTEWRRYAPRTLARVLPQRRHDATRETSGPVTYVEGACMLVRREAFDAVGGFDPAFFLFFEELDIARRLRGRGWTVDLVADAVAQHEVAASRRSTGNLSRPVLVESTVRYLAKTRGAARARLWVLGARPLWWLRVRRGQLQPDECRDYLAAARRGLGGV